MSDRTPPKYRAIANALRERIASGAIPPGSPLPPEPAIAREFDAGVQTVRQALGVLRNEGVVFTEHGRATFARAQLPVRRLASDRYRADAAQIAGGRPLETSFTRDQGISWSEYRLDKQFAEVPASAAQAELLDVPAGTLLLERRFVFHSRGYPQQMSTSCYPLDLVAGTPVADPDREPWPGGNLAQLATLGVIVTRVDERVRARTPLVDEAETLRIPSGVPVLVITRTMSAGERVVEVAEIVIPADRVEMHYRIDL